jgi:hypothetical protein
MATNSWKKIDCPACGALVGEDCIYAEWEQGEGFRRPHALRYSEDKDKDENEIKS